MESVLDFPLPAYRVSDTRGVGRQTADVVAALAAGMAADGSLALDDRDALQKRKQWDGRPHRLTATQCQSGGVSNHLI